MLTGEATGCDGRCGACDGRAGRQNSDGQCVKAGRHGAENPADRPRRL
jgi:hypothetical protein